MEPVVYAGLRTRPVHIIPDMSFLFEIIIILVLIGINGIFALSEFAIVSAKKTRLMQLAEEGDLRAAVALDLADEPTAFLSTIQIGITLAGIFAGAFGGAMVAEGISGYLREVPFLAPYSDIVSITFVVLVITYITLVFGELVPKRLALLNPERTAIVVARPMQLLSRIAMPLVVILSSSTNTVLRLFRVRDEGEPPVTEEDIRILLAEGTEAGVFEEAELSMVKGVFDLDDTRVESLMTLRPDIIALDLRNPVDTNLQVMIASHRSYFPVYEDNLDNIVGMVGIKDILAEVVRGNLTDIRSILAQPLFIPEGITILTLLGSFKESGVPIAVVTDEYGTIVGIITLHDILEAIVGDVNTLGEPVKRPIVEREDGSWLIDGDAHLEDITDILSLDLVPPEGRGHYRTIAGFILSIMQEIPATGDHFEYEGFRFEVVDMDKNRIDKVLVSRILERSFQV